jgi:parvulin-like peptidyl-prolyl isomerase
MSKKELKKIKPLIIVYTLAGIIVAYILIIAVLIYGFGMNNKIIAATTRIIPYPAAIIGNNKFVTISEINNDLQAVKNFYEVQDFSKLGLRVDFSTDEGQKRLKIREKQLLNKMIENKVIEILSKERSINITDEMVDQSVKRKMDEYGTEQSASDNLKRLYGWTLEDFKNKVVKPSLYAEALEKSVLEQNQESFSAEAKEKINKAKQELDAKNDFTEVAKKYSEGQTAGTGGDLGWFTKEQLVGPVADTVFSLKKGEISSIVESELGYHIVKLEDKKTENGSDLVKISQIFARKKTFADWLDEKIKQSKVYLTMKNYYWNKEKGVAEFRDENLKNFEKSLLENNAGDASVMF